MKDTIIKQQQGTDFDARPRAALRGRRYDSDRLQALLRRMDPVQIRIFASWQHSETSRVGLAVQLLSHQAAGLIYDYKDRRYRKPTEHELSPPGSEPKVELLSWSEIVREFKRCIQPKGRVL